MIDITREESEANFHNTSILNKRELIYILDAWIERAEKNDFDISLCKASAEVMRNALKIARNRIISMELPSIQKHGSRYCLDIFRDYIQVGLESFDNDDLFDQSGHIIPIEYNEDEVIDIPEDYQDPNYTFLIRVPIPQWSINKWSEENNIKPKTTRQYITRGRIPCVKTDGNLKISAIQYTPDAYARAKQTHFRFKQIGHLPDHITEKYPELSGNILDLIITYNKDYKPDTPYSKLIIKIPDDTKEADIQLYHISDQEKQELIQDILACDNVKLLSDKYYYSPVGEAIPTPDDKHPELYILSKSDQEILKQTEININTHCHGSACYSKTPGDSLNREIPAFDANFNINNTNAVQISGYTYCRDNSKEAKLIRAIFGEKPPHVYVSHAIQETSINCDDYPWNKHILLVTDINIECDPEHAIPIIRNMPYSITKYSNVPITLIIIALKTKKHDNILEQAGYKKINNSHNNKFVYYYAYMPSVSVINEENKEKYPQPKK